MVSISTPSETSLHQQNLKPKRMQSDQTTRSAGDFPIADSEIPFLGFSNRPGADAWQQIIYYRVTYLLIRLLGVSFGRIYLNFTFGIGEKS